MGLWTTLKAKMGLGQPEPPPVAPEPIPAEPEPVGLTPVVPFRAPEKKPIQDEVQAFLSCPRCKRTVYAFNTYADGSKLCLDCATRRRA